MVHLDRWQVLSENNLIENGHRPMCVAPTVPIMTFDVAMIAFSHMYIDSSICVNYLDE